MTREHLTRRPVDSRERSHGIVARLRARFARLPATLCAAALVFSLGAGATGCFGRFRVVRAVYEFNASVENKFLRSLVTFALVVIPVYGVAGLADWIVFNTIEFWSGSPAIASRALPDGGQIRIARVSPDVLRITKVDAGGRSDTVEVVKVSERAGLVRRPAGEILATVELTDDGRVVQRAGDGLEGAAPATFMAAAGAR